MDYGGGGVNGREIKSLGGGWRGVRRLGKRIDIRYSGRSYTCRVARRMGRI